MLPRLYFIQTTNSRNITEVSKLWRELAAPFRDERRDFFVWLSPPHAANINVSGMTAWMVARWR
jgi:hypothetical protein